jgi:hypothetical protein
MVKLKLLVVAAANGQQAGGAPKTSGQWQRQAGVVATMSSCSFEEPWRTVQLNPTFDESRGPCELTSFRLESIPLRWKKRGSNLSNPTVQLFFN